MKVLVTGASGFIGQHLVRALSAQGHQVRYLLRPAASAPVNFNGRTQRVWGDMSDADSLHRAVEGVDQVYHLAAIRDRWGLSFKEYNTVNVQGTRHLLEAAARQGARFIYCSSVGVLGYPGVLNIDESFDYRTRDGKFKYHHTKALSEQLTLAYARTGRLEATVVRPVITYGPGDTYGMVTKLLTLLASGRFLPIGSGRNHVHLAYITDTVRGLILASESAQANGQVYILPGTRPITMQALIDLASSVVDQATPGWHVPLAVAKTAAWLFESAFALQRQLGLNLLGEEPFLTRDKIDTLTVNRGFDGTRAATDLGYYPTIDYAEGLAQTVAWARKAQLLPN
ncbi:MAG: NAD-dependent epimerase/dehydratase family protein [Chloroflexota bacterium]